MNNELKNKYAIFSDVDNTIYTLGPSTITQPTIDAVKKAKQLGVELVLVSGNGQLSALERCKDLLDVRYLISANGAACFDYQEQKFLFNYVFNGDDIKRIINIFKNSKHIVLCYSALEKKLYAHINGDKIPDIVVSRLRKIMIINNEKIYDIEEAKNINIFLILNNDNIDPLIGYENKIKQLQSNYIFYNDAIEITPLNVNKGEAVKYMLKHLNLKNEDVMVIGDGLNDHSMLELENVYSYTLANAKKETKKITKYHTSRTEQNGLAEAINDFLIRKKIIKNKIH